MLIWYYIWKANGDMVLIVKIFIFFSYQRTHLYTEAIYKYSNPSQLEVCHAYFVSWFRKFNHQSENSQTRKWRGFFSSAQVWVKLAKYPLYTFDPFRWYVALRSPTDCRPPEEIWLLAWVGLGLNLFCLITVLSKQAFQHLIPRDIFINRLCLSKQSMSKWYIDYLNYCFHFW